MDTTGLLAPQIDHAKRLLDSLYLNGVASDLSETGCGKTFVSACIAKGINCPVVVIAPKLVLPVWEKVLALFGVKADVLINYEKLCRGNTPWLKYNECHKTERWMNTHIKFPPGSLIIMDESHKCKGPTSLQAGLMVAAKKQGYRALLLSATQATSPLEMKAFGFVNNLHKMDDFKSWCIDAGAEWVGRWGAQYFQLDSPEAQAKMRQIHENLFDVQGVASRLTRDMMGDLFPENQIQAEAYDMGVNSVAIQNIYDMMEAEILRLEERTEGYAMNHLAAITKARRMVEMKKVPTILEMIEDLWDEGKSVAVFVNYTDTIDAIVSRLGNNKKWNGEDGVGMIYGGRSHKRKLQDIEDFNADRKRILICNLAAGGQSINLHDLNGNHPRATIINPSFSAYHLLQALGRIHRQGGLTKCYQRILFAAGTIEERACVRVQARCNNLSLLNDGDMVDGMRFFSHCIGKDL